MEVNVAIVDDNKEDIQNILQCLNDNLSMNILLKVETFSDQSFSEVNKKFDLYLLDIDMPTTSGIELAEKINEYCKESRIIFISRREDLVFDTFIVESLYFVRKDKLEDDLKQAIHKYLDYFEMNNKVYKFFVNGIEQTVKYRDIYYFEVFRNNLYVITKFKKYSIRKAMKSVVNDVSEDTFIRIHESFYINMNNIESINDDIVIMKNKHELHISRRNVKFIKQKYAKYLMQRG